MSLPLLLLLQNAAAAAAATVIVAIATAVVNTAHAYTVAAVNALPLLGKRRFTNIQNSQFFQRLKSSEHLVVECANSVVL